MSTESIKYYFEQFCFDVNDEQLFKDGSPVALTHKTLNVLLTLLQNNERFVKKSEIIEQVWNENFVEEANLTQHIYILRKTLGQNLKGKPFIESMPKRGYRLTVPVVEKKMNISQIKTISNSTNGHSNHPVSTANKSLIEDEKTAGYQFGNFKLDILRRLLYQDDQQIALPSKVFDTLLYLIENAGQLVRKDDLMDKIWQERFVEENNLTQKIFILRRVLGDTKETHQFIVTVSGEGYVFVAPVAKYSNDSIEVSHTPLSISTKTPAITLAVLPFKRFALDSSLPKDDFLGIGLADTLTSQLSRHKELIIRPTSSVIRFYNQNLELSEISQKLEVGYLVEGNIQEFGGKLKVSVQLFETATNGIVWADNYISDNSDILELQNQISNQISKNLAQNLNLVPQSSKSFLPDNFEAFQEYIKGKFYFNKRTVEGLKKGIEHAQNALEIDPTFAMAYVGLADCYNLLAGQHTYMAPNEAFPKAKAASERAVEISGDFAEAYSSLAFATYYFDWNRQLAEQYFKKAIELKPNYPTAHHWYGESLAAEKRFDESIEVLRKAQELDPLSPAISTDLAQTFLFAGKIKESQYLLDQILELNPHFVRALYLYGIVYEELNQFEKALEILQKANDLSPNEPAILAEIGYVLATLGENEKACEIINKLNRIAETRYVSSVLMAMIYFALNKPDEAFKSLEKALENRDGCLVWIDVFPQFRNFRDDSKFVSLAKKLNIA